MCFIGQCVASFLGNRFISDVINIFVQPIVAPCSWLWDNAPEHKLKAATNILPELESKVLPHLPYSPNLASGEVLPWDQPHQWQHGQACVGTHQQHHGHGELLGGLKQVARAPKIMCLSKRWIHWKNLVKQFFCQTYGMDFIHTFAFLMDFTMY